MKNSPSITKFSIETTEGYFVAFLDNGGVRIGLKGFDCFDFPLGHTKFQTVVSLQPSCVENYYDELYGATLYSN